MSDEPGNRKENKKRTLPKEAEPYKFKPGQSGNPNGRPKKKPITELYEELMSDPEIREQIKQAIRNRLTSGRMVGAMEMKEAADRLEGKVTQPLEGTFDVNLSLADRMQKARERVSE